MTEKRLKIYFAGDLFDHKDLAGNLLIAEAIEKYSNGRYQIMLPQDGECEVENRTSQSIRDADFYLLFNSDLIVANFDGPDLDSGTVVVSSGSVSLAQPQRSSAASRTVK